MLTILAGSLFTLGSCWAAGKLLLDRLNLRFHALEELFFRFVLGSACLSLLIFGLTAVFLARTWVFLVVGIAVIFLGLRSRNTGERPAPLPALPKAWTFVFVIFFGIYSVFYFVNALAPETSPDGSTYHLGLVARYLRQHGFGRITTDMYASLSEGLEMLFLPAFAIGKHSAAALVEFAFLVALPLGMLAYGRRTGYPVAGIVGGLFLFTSPLFGVAGTSAYNDAAGACVLFAAFFLLQIWIVSRDGRLIPLMGLLAGFAFGVKYTMFLAAPYLGAVLLWKLWRAKQEWLRPILIFSACALLMMVPWPAKSWIVVANPFSPFLNRVFPNPYVSIEFEDRYTASMRNPEHLPVREWMEQALWKGEKTSGFLGPQFLLAPLSLFALRFAVGRQLLLAGFIFFLPALTNIQARFLMPCVPFISLALGIAVSQIPAAAWVFVAIPAVLGWHRVYPKYCGRYAWKIRDFPINAALRKIPEAKTIETRMPEIALIRLIDEQVPRGGRVFSFGSPPEAYSSREIVIGYESAFGNSMIDLLQVPVDPNYFPTRLYVLSFPEMELRKLRVVQTAGEEESRWSIAELRIYNGKVEIERDAKWRISAKPNRWDIGSAFDNNDATRWDSEQPMYAGMEVSVDFGRLQIVDSVKWACSHDQWQRHLKIQGADADGVWEDIPATIGFVDRESEPTLRRQAEVAAKKRGITHLLVRAGDYYADDYYKNRDQWGLELVGEALDARLYRLK